MKRFILNSEADSKGKIRLTGADYHYLARVRRLAEGEVFPALLPCGAKVLIHVDSVDGAVLTGTVSPEIGTVDSLVAGQGQEMQDQPLVILFQALPKGDKMDLIVRQAAEGGLSEIVPFISQFSLPEHGKKQKTLKNDAFKAKITRWQKIIKEARQQSGSNIATKIREPVDIDGLFSVWEDLKKQHVNILGLLLHQIPLENESLHRYLDKWQELIVIVIGPEGGFSSEEVSGFLKAGFKPLLIGHSVLRTETAAVYAASAVQIILQERDSWELSRK